jgi:serine/threonine-protein kinase
LLDTLQVLHAAHELTDRDDKPLNLVHRDVSPTNILVGTDGVARITDFGVARAEARLTSTRGGQVKGKLQYMPPEQIIADEVDRRADVYAAGVVMWELLVGRRLFDAQHEGAVLQQVLNGARTSPAQENPRVPKAIDQVCMKALSVDPADRFPSAIVYAEEVEEASRAAGLRVASGQRVATFVRGFETNASKIAEARKSLPGTLPTLDLGGAGGPTSRAAAGSAETPASQTSVPDQNAQGVMIQASAAQVLSSQSAAFMAPQLQQSRRGLVMGLGVGLLVGIAAVVVAITKPWAEPAPSIPVTAPPPPAATPTPEPVATETVTSSSTESATSSATASASADEEPDPPPATRPGIRRPPPPRKPPAGGTAKPKDTSGGSAADFLPPTL